ncbi:MAG TPA: cytochrome b N-terminal domain-containing protein [Bryobacteraceae bacterium]|nr:cytochrome b N-terminal domain-containing protein [Bryobacteraceae bacterium]
MISILRSSALWLEDRLHITKLYAATAGHHVPASTNSWFYVFGSGTLVCLILQIVTGICLAFVYVPSADHSWTTLQYLNDQQFLGSFLRAVHYWASNFMVGIMTLHVIQVFLFGAYKYPRELTWISGCILLFCTLGMAFTGQVLRFDQDAYWGLGIGASIMGRVPVLGAQLVRFMLAGPIIGGATLTRFFSLHVFIIPGLILALVALHLRLVLTKGINEYPKPGHPVVKETYDQEYEELIHKDGVPFAPNVIGKDLLFSASVILGILVCALVFGHRGPTGPPDPTLIITAPKPDYYFLPVFAGLALLPAYTETVLLLTLPVVIIVLLVALPFISNTGEKSWRRRPFSVLLVAGTMVVLFLLAQSGLTSPWSPSMSAWSSDPIPVRYLAGRTPLEVHGAIVIQNKQCRNCHSMGGRGGLRGPMLDGVATRLTADQLVRQVIQGSGNMPAYGKNLSPAEVSAVVAFMETLRPASEPPAHDANKH